MRRPPAIALVVLAIVAAACSEGAVAPPPPTSNAVSPGTMPASPSASPAADPPAQPNLAAVRIRLDRVATLEQPLAMATRTGDSALYIAEKTGRVVALRGLDVDPEPIVDLTDRVSLGSEQGLLGLAFSPNGRFLYVNYTDVNGHTHVTEFAMDERGAVAASERDVLIVEQPATNHNGGNLVFGPDGYLYVGLGDGGSGASENAQSTSTLLGKMLRIDPRPAGGLPYGIPPDNPFVDRSGIRPEIWALGLRNPWRYSFDRRTGDLWLGDVGQSGWEEIDRQPVTSRGGKNYGWNVFEGNHRVSGGDVAGAVAPVFEYAHAERGCSVIGGYVYRGRSIPNLTGAYVFGDLCFGELEALRVQDGRVVGHRILGPVVPNLVSFGEDRRGELYALGLGGTVYRLAPDV
jgi:glucose/arabinose dehydrogenase